jgi:hypothetical protein
MKQYSNYKNANELLVGRACEVIESLDLDLKNPPVSLNSSFLYTRKKGSITANEVKKEIFRLGYGESNEINFPFIEKVYKQIIYLLKFN